MATHHGRRGGRGLELLLLFGVLAVTLIIFVGGVVALFLAEMFLVTKVVRISPGLLIALNGIALTYWYRPGGRLVWRICALIWTPFLRYYKYDPHTLKPIVEGENHDRTRD